MSKDMRSGCAALTWHPARSNPFGDGARGQLFEPGSRTGRRRMPAPQQPTLPGGQGSKRTNRDRSESLLWFLSEKFSTEFPFVGTTGAVDVVSRWTFLSFAPFPPAIFLEPFRRAPHSLLCSPTRQQAYSKSLSPHWSAHAPAVSIRHDAVVTGITDKGRAALQSLGLSVE